MEKFEVIFLDDDNETILDKQFVNKGDKVTYKGKKPEKPIENQVRYTFIGWVNEEKLVSVQENLKLVAKYDSEVLMNPLEEAFYNATLEIAQNADINSTLSAGEKIICQLKSLEKDTRTAEEIVKEVLENGKTELATNKEDLER